MTDAPRRRFLEGGFSVLVSMAVGLVAELAGFPWLALGTIPLLLLVRPLRRSLATHEFFVVASVVAAVAIGAMTLVGRPGIWTSLWFLSLLGSGGLASVVCLVLNLKKRRGVEALAYVLIHAALPVILVGSGMKALWKVEGMLILHEGQSTSTLKATEAGVFTGETLELPFQVRLDRFRVEFYPKRVMLHLFSKASHGKPVGSLEIAPGESMQVDDMRLEAGGIQAQEREPTDFHKGMELSFAMLEINGTPVKFPLAATKNDRTMPFPWGESVSVNELLHAAAMEQAEAGDRPAPSFEPSPYVLVFRAPEGEFVPARCSVELHANPEDAQPLLSLPLETARRDKLPNGTLELAVKGVTKSPMQSEDLTDGPAVLTTAHLSLDGHPIVFPVGIAGAAGEEDLPVGDKATLAQLVRVSRESMSMPETELPAIYDEFIALFDVVQEPRSFRSRLTILTVAGEEIASEDVRVNEPLRFDGWWLYQADWSDKDLSYSGIQVVRDPGLWVALTGLFLLALGAVLHLRRMLGAASSGGAV